MYEGHSAKRMKQNYDNYYYYHGPGGEGGRPDHRMDKPGGYRNDDRENHVLLITVINPAYPITCDIIHQICSPQGKVLRVVIFKKNGVQAMVEFDTIDSAKRVKNELHGCDIYSGCCTLRIEYAKPTRLNVYKNDSESFDYTKPTVGKPMKRPSLLGEPGGMPGNWNSMPPHPGNYPPPLDHGPQEGHGGVYPANSGEGFVFNEGDGFGGGPPRGPPPNTLPPPPPPSDPYGDPYMQHQPPPPPPPGDPVIYRDAPAPPYCRGPVGRMDGVYASAPPPPPLPPGGPAPPPASPLIGDVPTNPNGPPQQGSVIMVYGLDFDRMNADRLFNLFCLFGNVVRTKFLKSKEGCAMVQMGDPIAVERAINALNNLTFFGKKMQLSYSKQAFLNDVQAPFELNDGTLSFKDFMGNRYNRFTNPEAASKNRIALPAKVVHFFNAPYGMKEEEMLEIFKIHGPPSAQPTGVTMFQSKTERSSSGLIQFESVSDAVEALVYCNHVSIPNPS